MSILLIVGSFSTNREYKKKEFGKDLFRLFTKTLPLDKVIKGMPCPVNFFNGCGNLTVLR